MFYVFSEGPVFLQSLCNMMFRRRRYFKVFYTYLLLQRAGM